MLPAAGRRPSAPVRIRLVALFLALSLIAVAIPQSRFIQIIPTAQAASPNVVISQVYGGGGATTGSPAYINDYVELFNTSNAPVTITGWSLQYGSSTGNFGNTGNVYVFPATTIPAGKYLLVRLGAPGTLGANFTSDQTSTGLSMSATAGKVALANIGTTLGCGATATPCLLPDARIVDSVAWGSSNNGEGGTTVNNGSSLNSTQGGIRKANGCQDTDNNNNDFVVGTTSSSPALVPRNSASAAQSCVVANNPPTINAPANPAATVSQNAPPFNVNLSGNDDGGVYNWSASPGTGIQSVNVTSGQGTANVAYTVTLQNNFTGTATFTASLSDNVNPPATQAVNIQVNPVVVNNPPAINAPANPIRTVEQDAPPFTVSLTGSDDGGIYNWSATNGTGVSSANVTGGQGTSSVTYTVTLQSGYNGTATFTAMLSDNVNPAVSQAVNITVNAPPPPPDHMVISQIYGGGGNTSATYQNDYVELYNPTNATVDLAGWSVQYASATGNFTQTQPLGGVVQPGEYFLIKLGTNGAVGAALPPANIDGEINLSATNGKVALSNSGDPLPAGCPIGNAALVDLVGYGTANCREGSANAPAPSNTTALFRKNGGLTDDNVNSTDFVTATPNPRRTTPIQEIGPAVSSSEPRRDGTNAPRDASVTITFTEPVTVDASWFSINCPSGAHNDATIATVGRDLIITPNVNFQPGEQCTVTINKDQVHDVDTDDSAPNTDTLPANFTYTFTVATGTAPAYPADVHLAFGNPTNASPDLNTPGNYLMVKPEFSLSYNRDRGTPNWVSWHLADEWVGSLSRVDTFRADPAVTPDWYRVNYTDYFSSGFDRGHMVPNADRDKETSIPINQATFLMTNMIPQAPDNNQGPWADMENYLRTLLPANELYIVAGGAGNGGTGSSGFMTTIAGGKVAVPAQTWKVVLVLPKDNSGDDVSRVSCATRTIAVIMPNTQGIRNNDWQGYITTVDAVENLTGYNFYSNLNDPVERCVEAGTNGVNPPLDTDEDGVADSVDNCTFVANTNQLDTDNDATGDACDTDDDGDGVSDADEATAGSDPLNSASTPEVCDGVDNDLNDGVDEGFTNTDGDPQADCVDTDDDGDGVSDVAEETAGSDPLNSASTPEVCDGADNDLNDGVDEGFANTDGDSQADCVDADDDNDGQTDVDEAACGSNPLVAASKSPDNDADNSPDCVDADDDNDGVADTQDAFPFDPNESVDTDGDNIGNNADTDDDGDGQSDADELSCGSDPLDASSKATDTDGDTRPNCADADDDGDGVIDTADAFPLDPTETTDTDGDGIGNNADTDDDNDGVADAQDAFPLNPAESVDTDGDGTGNNADMDDDGDGVVDAIDNCPLRPNPSQEDFDGDGIGDACESTPVFPTNKDQCKNGGWMTWTPRFKNQGDCVSYTNTGR